MLKNLSLLFILLSFSIKGFAYTIEDKRKDLLAAGVDTEMLSESDQNARIKALNISLQEQYQIAAQNVAAASDAYNFDLESKKIQEIREQILDLENAWISAQKEDYHKNGENSGFWELGETTISKLIIEYGSAESLYVIPPEIGSLKLSLHCLLSIPKESWPKMIELILTYNNIGVKKLNPFVKQLFLLKDQQINVDVITSDIDYLSLLESTSRVIFIYNPPTENIKSTFYFLDKFKNIKNTFIYQIGPKIAIAGPVKDVLKLTTLADNVWDKNDQRISKILTPQKISPEDAVKLLKSYFGGLTDYSRPVVPMKGGNGLSAFTLKKENSLILIGSKKKVDQAENLLKETESQVIDPTEVTLYWHTCDHCKPIELAETLSKVYTSLISCSMENTKQAVMNKPITRYPPGAAYGSHYPPTQEIKESSPKSKVGPSKSEHFFPFPATGSLLMVVRKDTLCKIKEIIKKLDTPKKMVEIEVLLCERRLDNSSKSGINLLKLAGAASNTDNISSSYARGGTSSGIMEFLFSGTGSTKSHIPAMDLSYSFILSQEDVMVTASPSTTTLNQVAATLSITDQISIHNGANGKNVSSYQREDFGITLTLTPTVHERSEGDAHGQLYITLENDIQFDTITNIDDERPTVHKRHITNTVRIPNGETVIIGGLRASSTEEVNQKIPFLGEIPGFAKIFGSNVSSQKNSEMFIFIKPRVIEDPATDLLRIREEKLKRRPGDSEALLTKINESRRNEEEVRFQNSFNLLFGSGNRHEQTL
ncbi:MAG: Type 3 secretion system secretin [Chlamydiia bacterium]|nr:Type 3 secretion system secretin [Chlamydiia bacterium]MCH9618544.1 Type 3 secretion system secretin [Chlamydiia bacterium]